MNAPHLFKDLHLNEDKGQVDGINSGLDIAGQGTFTFSITDDNEKSHRIKIPNNLYIPKLRRCLLLPQHWEQETGDEQTWMGNYRDRCVFELEGRQENSSFPADDQCAGFLHGSSLLQLSHICRNLRGNGSPILLTGKGSSTPWVQGPDGRYCT